MPFYIKNKRGQTEELSVDDIFSIASTGKAKRVDKKTGKVVDKVFLKPENGISFREKLVNGRLFVTPGEIPGATLGQVNLPEGAAEGFNSQLIPVDDNWLTGFYQRNLTTNEGEDFGDGHIIPTLSEMADYAAKTGSKMIAENPFEADLKKYKREYERTGTEASKKKYDQYAGMSKDWETELESAEAPEWGSGTGGTVGKTLENVGSHLDAVDFGTAFLPVGAAVKGAAWTGRGLAGIAKPGTQAAKNFATLANTAAKHPYVYEGLTKTGEALKAPGEFLVHHPRWNIAADAAEQGLIESAHGAATYRPEEGEGQFSNALEQGGLAGLMQAGISGFGGGRLRAIKALPENKRALTTLEELRKRGIDVPEYSPLARAGKEVLSDSEIEDLVLKELDKANALLPPGLHVTEQELNDAIAETVEEMKSRGWMYPSKQMEKFDDKFKATGYDENLRQVTGELTQPWEQEIRGRLPRPVESGTLAEEIVEHPGYDLFEILSETYRKPVNAGIRTGGRIGEPIEVDVGAKADRTLAKNILKRKGLYDPNKFVDRVLSGNMYEIDYSNTPNLIDRNLENVEELRGLKGIKYASKPMDKAAETGFNKMVSQVPGVKHMPRIYETQSMPTITKYDLGALWNRVMNNLLLDAAREGTESGLDYLDDRYKK